jgi:hypothetical protein
LLRDSHQVWLINSIDVLLRYVRWSIEGILLLLCVHVVGVVSCWIETTLALALRHHETSRLVCLNDSRPDVVECIRLFALEEVAANLALTHLLLLLLCLNFQLLLLH